MSGLTGVPAIIVVLALGTGCAQPLKQTSIPSAPQMQTSFDVAEHEPYKGVGTASITGQGFLRQRGGGTVTCAGSEVFLFPATPYFREILTITRTHGRAPSVSANLSGYERRGRCDAQGNFQFSGVPALAWFVTTEVSWRVGYRRQGGALVGEVRAVEGAALQILLSDREFFGR